MAARGQSIRTVGRMIAYVRSAGAVAAATALAGAIISGPTSGTGGYEHSAGSHPRSAAVTSEAERETTHTLHATVISKRSASVHLVVRAHHGDRVVRTEQRQVRVVAGRARRVQVTVSTVQRAPRLTMRLVPTRPRPGDRFTVTRVRWTHRFPSVEPTPDPTPEPTPIPSRADAGSGAGPVGAATEQRVCLQLARHPRRGAYLGQAYGSNTDPTSLEADLGRRLGLRRTYFRADQVDSAVRIATTDLAAGRLPWVSFKLPHSWSDMTAGAGDAWVKSLSPRFGRLDGPVWLAFHHEPEGDGPIADWRRMQERLAPLVRAEENLAFTVIVTGWNQLYGDPTYSLDAIWPRGVTVMLLGSTCTTSSAWSRTARRTPRAPTCRRPTSPSSRRGRGSTRWPGAGGDRIHRQGLAGRPRLDPAHLPAANRDRRHRVRLLQHDAEQHRAVAPRYRGRSSPGGGVLRSGRRCFPSPECPHDPLGPPPRSAGDWCAVA